MSELRWWFGAADRGAALLPRPFFDHLLRRFLADPAHAW
eukprot:gene16274-7126_t